MSKKNKTTTQETLEVEKTEESVENLEEDLESVDNETSKAETDEELSMEGEMEAESKEENKKDSKDKKDILIDELNDKVKRQMAEFDNFRKRTEKEKSMMFEMGASDVIKKLLPVVDNFERGFKSVSEEELETPFAKGMDMVYKQLVKMLEDLQVKPIEAVGIEFNPDFHNAVMHIEDDSYGENVIVEEFEKGYIYRDSVIRQSMVKVAN